MKSSAVLGLALGLLCAPAAADDVLRFLDAPDRRGGQVLAPPNCQGGLRNDDGSFEGATGYANAVQVGAYVMALDIPAGFQPTRVCLCWTRGPFNNGTDLDFDVVFFADDGVGAKGEPGFPGTELGRTSARAEAIPEFLKDGVAMYPVDLPPELRALSGRIHVGVEWQPFVNRQFFICNDTEAEGSTERPVFEGYSNVPPEPFWSPLSPMRPTYRAFGTVLYGELVAAHDFECRDDLPGCIPPP